MTNTAAITTESIDDARGRRVARVTAGVPVTRYLCKWPQKLDQHGHVVIAPLTRH